MLERLKKWLRRAQPVVEIPGGSDVRIQRREMKPGHERIVVDVFRKIRTPVIRQKMPEITEEQRRTPAW